MEILINWLNLTMGTSILPLRDTPWSNVGVLVHQDTPVLSHIYPTLEHAVKIPFNFTKTALNVSKNRLQQYFNDTVN